MIVLVIRLLASIDVSVSINSYGVPGVSTFAFEVHDYDAAVARSNRAKSVFAGNSRVEHTDVFEYME